MRGAYKSATVDQGLNAVCTQMRATTMETITHFCTKRATSLAHFSVFFPWRCTDGWIDVPVFLWTSLSLRLPCFAPSCIPRRIIARFGAVCAGKTLSALSAELLEILVTIFYEAPINSANAAW